MARGVLRVLMAGISGSKRLRIKDAGVSGVRAMTNFPFDIVGFDLDGTLLDTSGDLGAALNHALLLAGREQIPSSEVPTMIGGGSKRMLDRAMERTGGRLPDDQLSKLYHDLIDYYYANISVHSQLFPGGEAMLDGLEARGVKIAMVTNKMERLAVRLLGELGLADRFCTILGGDSLGPGKAKPAPDLLHEMIARAGGGRAVYIGDTTYDTGAARAAGIPCVGVSFGFNDVPPAQLDAAAVIDHYDELIPVLERIA